MSIYNKNRVFYLACTNDIHFKLCKVVAFRFRTFCLHKTHNVLVQGLEMAYHVLKGYILLDSL